MYPFVSREHGVSYVTGPRLFLNVSNEAKEPRVQIINMFGEMLYETDLVAGFMGELDLGDANENLELGKGEDYILNFKSDEYESGV